MDRIYRVRNAYILLQFLIRPAARREALASSSVSKCTALRGNKVWNYSEDIAFGIKNVLRSKKRNARYISALLLLRVNDVRKMLLRYSRDTIDVAITMLR